jgi:hypothetical protein
VTSRLSPISIGEPRGEVAIIPLQRRLITWWDSLRVHQTYTPSASISSNRATFSNKKLPPIPYAYSIRPLSAPNNEAATPSVRPSLSSPNRVALTVLGPGPRQ